MIKSKAILENANATKYDIKLIILPTKSVCPKIEQKTSKTLPQPTLPLFCQSWQTAGFWSEIERSLTISSKFDSVDHWNGSTCQSIRNFNKYHAKRFSKSKNIK